MSAAASINEKTETLPARIVYPGIGTPWGSAQQAKMPCPGIGIVSTASHGGYRVCEALNRRIPDYARIEDGWYEEDAASCIVEVFLEEFLLAGNDSRIKEVILSGAHKATLKDWYPDAYEQFFGVTLQPGESCVNDERLFNEAHHDDWVGISASGDWSEGVPKGTVGVVARLGGRARTDSGSVRRFLVPAEEYDGRNRFGFVIDLERHQEVEDF